MQRRLLFSGSTGLNTVVDPVRHEYKETGINVLAVAKNIEHDFTGRISRRKGWSNTSISGSCHSLFCDGGTSLFTTGDALTLVSADLSTKALRNVTVGAKMSFVQIGDKIYYSNGREKGYIFDNVSRSWTKPSTVHGVKDTTRILSGPPTGSLLEYFNGRMYIVQMNVAWASEFSDVNAYNLAKSFLRFESPITMFKGVTGGIWVGTRNRIAFLRGSALGELQYELKGLFGSIPGTEVKVDGFKVGNGDIPGICVLFATKYGPCLGTSDGKLIPLTDRKLTIPYALKGSGVVINSKYIFSLGDSAAEMLTVSLELNSLAPSQLKNFNFNSFCELNGSFYGANGSGIFKLEDGDRDALSSISTTAIDAEFTLGPTDLGYKTDKRLRKCNITLEANGPFKMLVSADEGEWISSEVFPGYKDNREHAIEIPFGRDVQGRYLAFTFKNINGSDFSINNIEAFIEILSRKPKREGVS